MLNKILNPETPIFGDFRLKLNFFSILFRRSSFGVRCSACLSFLLILPFLCLFYVFYACGPICYLLFLISFILVSIKTNGTSICFSHIWTRSLSDGATKQWETKAATKANVRAHTHSHRFIEPDLGSFGILNWKSISLWYMNYSIQLFEKSFVHWNRVEDRWSNQFEWAFQ